MPMNYICKFRDFEEDFLKFVDEKYASIKEGYKRRNGVLTYVTRVHIEKMGNLGYELVRMGLANQKNGWFHMHRSVANDFMFYLATLIGHERNSQPISDRAINLRSRISIGNQIQRNQINREGLRRTIIDNLFPTPMEISSVSDLYTFKQRHETQLKDFRRYIETELLNIDAASEQYKSEMINKLFRVIEEEKRSISEKMENKWGFISGSGILQLSAVGTMIMGAGNNYGYAGAAISVADLIYTSIRKSRNNVHEALNRPLAYVYLVDRRYSNKRPRF